MKHANNIAYNWIKNAGDSLHKFIVTSAPLLLVAFATRIFELLLFIPLTDFGNNIRLNGIGLFYDVMFMARALTVLFIVFLAIDLLVHKRSKLIIRILITLSVFISCILVTYYSIAGVPLDKSLFAYSLKEILGIIGSSQKAAWWNYIFIVGIPAFYYWASRRDFEAKDWHSICFIILVICGFLVGKPTTANAKDQYTADNKLRHFAASVVQGFNRETDNPMTEDAKSFQSYFPDHKFISTETPFLHTDNSINSLTDFFNLTDTKPNFVFVVVEGLGREHSGPNSSMPSSTPFLDSLATHSLYWTNCLSTSMRTIQALPSIFGALPMGKTGFMNLRDNAPNYHSLLKILHQNGYRSAFFYGGWLCFDDMCHFVRQNQIDLTLDEHLYDSVPERNNWGLYDGYMFGEALRTIDFDNSPRIDAYLTLTTHDPFEYPDEERYTIRYRKMLNEAGIEASSYMTRAYASYLYLDDCLRQLIDGYRQKPGFENTIFVITGDHCFNTSSEPIEVHHVPLIIWSPMLKSGRQMDAMASHRDITPTLLAMLKDRYNISSPENVAWINRGLDTAQQFRCTTFSPLLDLSRSISRMIAHGCMTDENGTKKIGFNGQHLTLTAIDDSLNISDLLKSYRALDLYVSNNNALIESKKHHNGIYTVYTVESHGERMFLYDKMGLEVSRFDGRDNAADISSEFPLNFCQYTVTGKENQIIFSTSFKIHVPDIDNGLRIVTSISRNSEQIYWSAEEPCGNWFTDFNKWTEITTTYNMRADNYQYQKDDEIKIYIWNAKHCKAHLADLNISLKYTVE